MAFPEDDVYYQQQESSSPKLFTEYSLSAILAIVGLIGSFMAIMVQSITIIFLSWALVLTSTFDFIQVLTSICSLATIPLSVYQLYQANQLHKRSIHNFKMMQMIAGLIVVLAIVQVVGYATIPLMIGVIMLYALSGVIVFNLMIVYFLNQSEVRSEFE